MSLYNSNFRPLSIILCKIQDLKVEVQEHKIPILSLFLPFRSAVFSYSDTNTHQFLLFIVPFYMVYQSKKRNWCVFVSEYTGKYMYFLLPLLLCLWQDVWRVIRHVLRYFGGISSSSNAKTWVWLWFIIIACSKCILQCYQCLIKMFVNFYFNNASEDVGHHLSFVHLSFVAIVSLWAPRHSTSHRTYFSSYSWMNGCSHCKPRITSTHAQLYMETHARHQPSLSHSWPVLTTCGVVGWRERKMGDQDSPAVT